MLEKGVEYWTIRPSPRDGIKKPYFLGTYIGSIGNTHRFSRNVYGNTMGKALNKKPEIITVDEGLSFFTNIEAVYTALNAEVRTALTPGKMNGDYAQMDYAASLHGGYKRKTRKHKRLSRRRRNSRV